MLQTAVRKTVLICLTAYFSPTIGKKTTAWRRLTFELTSLAVENDVSRFSSIASRTWFTNFPRYNIFKFFDSSIHCLHQGCSVNRQKFQLDVFQTLNSEGVPNSCQESEELFLICTATPHPTSLTIS